MAGLEALVSLAQAQTLADLDEAALSTAAEAFESQTPYGSRWQAKADLIERLTGVRLPSGVSSSACDTIVRNYVYLTKELGVRDIGKVVTRLPQVLELTVEGMQAKVKYLQELGVTDIRKVVTRSPQVLEYTVEGMQKKFASYVLHGYGIADIEQFPASLGYSLENRIEPRFAFLQQLSASLGSGNTPLSTILAPKDTAFSKRFAGNETAYAEFLQNYSVLKPQS